MKNEYFVPEYKEDEDLGKKLEGLSVEELAELSVEPVDDLSEINKIKKDMEFFESHYDVDSSVEDEIELLTKLEKLKKEKIKNLTDSYDQAIKDYPGMKQEYIDDSKVTVEKAIAQIEEDFKRYIELRNKFIKLNKQDNK